MESGFFWVYTNVIKDGVDFRDLGGDYLTLRNKSQKVFHLRKQAFAMGFELVPQGRSETMEGFYMKILTTSLNH